jgi:hypothetical protein
VIAFTEPALTEAIRGIERRLTAIGAMPARGNWFTMGSDFRDQEKVHRRAANARSDILRELEVARRAQENDLKRQLESEELFLSAVMIEPVAMTQREPIPGAWASALNFDVDGNRVQFQDRLYISARVARRPPDAASVAPTAKRAENVSPAKTGVRTRGPESFAPMIEEAFLALVKGGRITRTVHKTTAARLSHEWLCKKYPHLANRADALPEEETVRKHLPALYAKHLGEKT